MYHDFEEKRGRGIVLRLKDEGKGDERDLIIFCHEIGIL